MQQPYSTNGGTVFRGRRWFGFILFVIAVVCLLAAISTIMIGWSAVIVMGLTLLASIYFCVTFGWAEIIARIALRADGFSVRLPRYRGYFPFWPAQRIEGKWSDVVQLRHRRVNARILGLRFDYVAHLIETTEGSIMLFEPLPGDLYWNTRGSGLNLPVDSIVSEFSRRSGRILHREDDVWGGGLWRNMIFGGPELFPAASSAGPLGKT